MKGTVGGTRSEYSTEKDEKNFHSESDDARKFYPKHCQIKLFFDSKLEQTKKFQFREKNRTKISKFEI